MNISGKRSGQLAGPLFIAAAIMMAGAGTSRAAGCQDLLDTFDRAVKARALDAARQGLDAIDDDPICSKRIEEVRTRYVDFLIDYAAAPGTSAADRKEALETAGKTLETSGNWKGKQKLGDYYFTHGDKANAFVWYQLSAQVLGTTPFLATAKEKDALMKKVSAAQSLSNDDDQGRAGHRAFVPSMRGPTGEPTGVFAHAFLRGAVAVKVPIPIQFNYAEITFTQLGTQSIQELADVALKEQPAAMRLVGHADPKGTDAYNMELSRRRVLAVRDALIQKGVKTDFKIEWKGAREPFDCSVLPTGCNMGDDEKRQLDRRVEWIRDGEPE
jgi:outer membrane protein OmpA-like peptidoglycan-associated protein